METHTQGPWVVKLKDRKWAIKGPDKKHSPVALVEFEGFGMGPSRAVRKANAHLIAAAPEMYTALQSMVLNYAQLGRVTESNVRDAARLLLEIDDERLG
jgi:hypothetical protein